MQVIYIIQNKVNNKIYIGKSSNFSKRIKKHLRDSKKSSRYLYQAIRKYSWSNFNSFVLEDVEDARIDEAEKFWIEYFRSWDKEFGYNLTFGGEGSIPTIETREKMRQAKLGKSNPNMQGEKHPFFGVTGNQHHRFGISHTPEAKKKIAEANVGRIFPNGSQRYNAKISEQDVLFMRNYFENNQDLKSKDIFQILAVKFEISSRTVESIIYKYSWKHVK